MRSKSVILLLGSNDAEAQNILHRAVEEIATSIGEVVKLSQSFRSEAYGFSSEREFINQAVEVISELDAYELLRRINHIEALLGRDREEERRVREARNEAYASRPIDIDIITFDDLQLNTPELTLPHPRAHERDFVMKPLLEIIPDFTFPS
jgi:2-amino-4-hydroxy-6-hydroxymethyldihydropteridine diphosphokinase